MIINFLRQFWRDETAYVLSAEAVTVGSIGVVGASVGIGKVSQLVNEELTETAYAIRSLDQSYVVPEQRGYGSWTAGSIYLQPNPQLARNGRGQDIEETPHVVLPNNSRPPAVDSSKRSN